VQIKWVGPSTIEASLSAEIQILFKVCILRNEVCTSTTIDGVQESVSQVPARRPTHSSYGRHRPSTTEGHTLSLLQDGGPEHSREKGRSNKQSRGVWLERTRVGNDDGGMG